MAINEVWVGDIVVAGLPSIIKDIHFWNTDETSINILSPQASLHLLGNVHVPSIPLYLPVGPSLEVSTDNADSTTWLSDRLNVEDNCVQSNDISEPWWSDASRQLDIGVLLKVEGIKEEGHATEILLYAKVENQQQDLRGLSPTVLSGNTLHDLPTVPMITVKVYALPLCSDILAKAQKASESEIADLTILPTSTFLQDSQIVETAERKRQKIWDLFEDATRQRRKRKGRGRQGLSGVVPNAEQTTSQSGQRSLLDQEEKASEPNGNRKELSNVSNTELLPDIEMRPVSRIGLANGKRSSLRFAESALLPRQASVLSESDSDYTLENKAALTKMVMASMRLHGLQQRKKRLSLSDRPGLLQNNSLPLGDEFFHDAEDDYKLIYHQTFKAAMFTFRAYFSERILGQNVMRDVVDRLLSLFCVDPLRPTNHQYGFVHADGAQQAEADSFSISSGIASLKAPIGGEWSTPPTKRRR